MDANHQDKPGSKPGAIEAKLRRPPLSSKDQEKLNGLHNNQMEDIVKQLRGRGYKVTEEYNDTGQISKVSREIPSRKTLWDWLQLLIIPLVLLGIGSLFSYQQNQTSLQMSQRQHETDIQIATEQQRETTLKTYLDDMSDLLLNHNLRKSKQGDEVSQVARERTLTTLRRLDAERNRIVLQFLQDARLIGMREAIIDLSNANLNHADLIGANLQNVDLGRANLIGANLSYALLYDVYLEDAYLFDANLSHAYLFDAKLIGVHLIGANLSYADLSNTLLISDLSHANLSHANLSHANLSYANLSYANLSYANLSHADLSEANLEGVTGITSEELEKQAKSLKGATMPDGSKHP